jgi:hypothetical protein
MWEWSEHYETPAVGYLPARRGVVLIAYSDFVPSLHNTSAKCKSVQKPYTTLPDPLVAVTSASKYFQMLPAPPGALQCARRLCKSILKCS